MNGRLKSLFAEARRGAGLGDSELAVLSAVVEAERPPTVPQIGRSFGQPRQQIQRAANSLMGAGLIEAIPNPDHKRASLLRATESGISLKRRADATAEAIAEELMPARGRGDVREATQALRAIRKQLEARLRG